MGPYLGSNVYLTISSGSLDMACSATMANISLEHLCVSTRSFPLNMSLLFVHTG